MGKKRSLQRKIAVFLITFALIMGIGVAGLMLLGNREYPEKIAPATVVISEDMAPENIAENDLEDAPVLENETDSKSPEEEAAELIAQANEKAVEELRQIVPQDRIQVLAPQDGETAVFTFAGDVLLDRNYSIYATYLNRGSEIENCISEDLLEVMRNCDVMMSNNEFPYTDRGEPLPGKTFTFHASPSSATVLQDMGVDIVSLANNHSFDYGEVSMLDSLDTLQGIGMPYVGAGHNLEEATMPYYYVVNGYKIGIISATQIERNGNPNTRGATEDACGVFRCMDPALLQETLTKMKENADFVILFIHWGTESTDVLDWAQTGQVEGYVDAGADLIIGAHPHVLQEVAYVKGVPVVYSLGNFWFNSRTLDSCVVSASIKDGELQGLQFLPCLQSGCSVKLLQGEERERVLNYMRFISPNAEIDEEGYILPVGSGVEIPITPTSRYVAPQPSPSASPGTTAGDGETGDDSPENTDTETSNG